MLGTIENFPESLRYPDELQTGKECVDEDELLPTEYASHLISPHPSDLEVYLTHRFGSRTLDASKRALCVSNRVPFLLLSSDGISEHITADHCPSSHEI